MERSPHPADLRLREALQSTGHRFTDQRAAVYRFLTATTTHPDADAVFHEVRRQVQGISLATVYKSLETLVNCGLASKLTYSDGSARYDARTEPHHHARCSSCGRVFDVNGQIPAGDLEAMSRELDGFVIDGYRLELTGACRSCGPGLAGEAETSMN
jgi:Fur family peroxide stress response transcriptional regulator